MARWSWHAHSIPRYGMGWFDDKHRGKQQQKKKGAGNWNWDWLGIWLVDCACAWAHITRIAPHSHNPDLLPFCSDCRQITRQQIDPSLGSSSRHQMLNCNQTMLGSGRAGQGWLLLIYKQLGEWIK